MQRTYQLARMAPTHASGAIAALIAAAGRRRHFAAGATIQKHGETGRGLWLVEAGDVMICRFGEGGDVTVYAVLGPGDLFGELALFAGVPRQVDAVAESAATMVEISPARIDGLLESEPDFARWLLRSLATQLRLALDRIEGDRSLPAETRLARALSDIAAREGPQIVITQQQLADFVSISRVTAGQVLAKFAAERLIVRGYGRIEVRNPAALVARGT